MKSNNFLYNHLVEVQDYQSECRRKIAYKRAITKNEINRFYAECIENNITLKNIIIELYFCITENTIEEFKSKYNIDDFNKLCLLTLSMFYIDNIKFNKSPISDRIAGITDFMFDYVSKFEPSIYELKDINSVPSEKVEIPKIKNKNSKEKVKVMSSPDAILFDSYTEADKYYGIKNTRYCAINGIRNEEVGQKFNIVRCH